jgi:hypothetical protein
MNEGNPTVKFARRVKSTSTLIWPQTDDISEIETEDVSAFLPEPVEGRRGGMTFPVSFSGLPCVLKFVFYLPLLSLSSLLQACCSLMFSVCLSLF